MSRPASHVTTLERIASGAGILAVGTVVGQGLSYLYKLLVAWLGPEAFGAFSLFLTMLGIATTLSYIGLTEGVVRFIAFYRGKGDDERVKGIIHSALRYTFLASLVVAAGLFLLARPLAVKFLHNESLIPLVWAVAIILPVYALYFIIIKSLVAFKELKYRVYVYNFNVNLVKVVATFVLLFLGWRLWAAIWGYGLAVLASLGLAYYLLEYKVFSFVRSPVRTVRSDRELLRFSFPLYFSGMVGMVLLWTDTLMLTYFTDLRQVGIYNAALVLTSVILFGSQLLLPIFLPSITELYAQGADEEVRRVYNTVNKWVVGISWPLFVLLMLYPRELLHGLFGSTYSVGFVALSILAIGRLSTVYVNTSTRVLSMMAKTRQIFAITAVAAVGNILLNYLWIPQWGINGAAAATATSMLLQVVLVMGVNLYYSKMHVFSQEVVKICALGLFSAGGLYFLKDSLPSSLFGIGVVMTGYGAFYSLGLYFLGVVDAEVTRIFHTVRGKVGWAPAE